MPVPVAPTWSSTCPAARTSRSTPRCRSAAYLEASQIAVTATGEEGARREALIKQHVKVLRSHIDTLASKAYWAGLDASPELVIAFIPSESLVSSAMEADPSIMDYAFNKRVALASPVTLWSVLKTVAFSWQQDVLTDQAKTLFDLSKELYSRLSTLSEHADKLRRSIDATVNSYNQFANSLETRVLVTARKLNALDESKVIGTAATIETGAKQLTAIEMELAALDELEGVHRPELELPDCRTRPRARRPPSPRNEPEGPRRYRRPAPLPPAGSHHHHQSHGSAPRNPARRLPPRAGAANCAS